MLESQGRLSPFVAMADDDGIDLLVYDKLTGHALPAQVKSRTATLKKRGSESRGNIVHFQIRAATFRVERFAVAILVLLGQQSYLIETAWVIPMRVLPEVARASTNRLVVRASRAPESSDRYSSFRCNSPAELYARIQQELDSLPVSGSSLA